MAVDPFSIIAQNTQAMNQAARADSGDAQNALLTMFQTEARRQLPYNDLPIDLAKQNHQFKQQMSLFDAKQQYKAQAQAVEWGGMSKEGGGLAVSIAENLARDLNIPLEVAAGIAGNLAAETGDFKHMQEIDPTVKGSRGGYGWAQWTGPRRKQFEAWAAQNGMNPATPEANYGYLLHELQNTPEGNVMRRIRNARTPEEAAQIFSTVFLRPGKPHMEGRTSRARAIYEKLGVTAGKKFIGDKEYDRRQARRGAGKENPLDAIDWDESKGEDTQVVQAGDTVLDHNGNPIQLIED